mmetsp:Transcript_12497/g.20228  ORF Transcript_12497/g.20228 Transcript_12497/m.20228 type:complete len:205 (-) Transcript_12497:441-1055(-)
MMDQTTPPSFVFPSFNFQYPKAMRRKVRMATLFRGLRHLPLVINTLLHNCSHSFSNSASFVPISISVLTREKSELSEDPAGRANQPYFVWYLASLRWIMEMSSCPDYHLLDAVVKMVMDSTIITAWSNGEQLFAMLHSTKLTFRELPEILFFVLHCFVRIIYTEMESFSLLQRMMKCFHKHYRIFSSGVWVLKCILTVVTIIQT